MLTAPRKIYSIIDANVKCLRVVPRAKQTYKQTHKHFTLQYKIAGLGAKHLVNDTYYYVILLIADRAKKISEELLKLWEKLSFPVISQQQVLAKVDKLVNVFEKYRKRPNEEFEKIYPISLILQNRV